MLAQSSANAVGVRIKLPDFCGIEAYQKNSNNLVASVKLNNGNSMLPVIYNNWLFSNLCSLISE